MSDVSKLALYIPQFSRECCVLLREAGHEHVLRLSVFSVICSLLKGKGEEGERKKEERKGEKEGRRREEGGEEEGEEFFF